MKQKTDGAKEIQGTYRKDREKKIRRFTLEEIPEPPKFLSKTAHPYFNSICEHLNDVGALATVDIPLVAMTAHTLHLYSYHLKRAGLQNCTQTFASNAQAFQRYPASEICPKRPGAFARGHLLRSLRPAPHCRRK